MRRGGGRALLQARIRRLFRDKGGFIVIFPVWRMGEGKGGDFYDKGKGAVFFRYHALSYLFVPREGGGGKRSAASARGLLLTLPMKEGRGREGKE